MLLYPCYSHFFTITLASLPAMHERHVDPPILCPRLLLPCEPIQRRSFLLLCCPLDYSNTVTDQIATSRMSWRPSVSFSFVTQSCRHLLEDMSRLSKKLDERHWICDHSMPKGALLHGPHMMFLSHSGSVRIASVIFSSRKSSKC